MFPQSFSSSEQLVCEELIKNITVEQFKYRFISFRLRTFDIIFNIKMCWSASFFFVIAIIFIKDRRWLFTFISRQSTLFYGSSLHFSFIIVVFFGLPLTFLRFPNVFHFSVYIYLFFSWWLSIITSLSSSSCFPVLSLLSSALSPSHCLFLKD